MPAHWPRTAGRRRLLLHAGLHKTGSTAIQFFLYHAADRLRPMGVLYPVTGRPQSVRSGHHNIAWQLAEDQRFDPQGGTLDQLAAEIAAFPGDTILSSEDFESVLATPARLLPLLRHPALRGHDTTLLFTLRDQASYLEALFSELLRHGIVHPADTVCAHVLTHASLRFERRAFLFDYAALHRTLTQAFGVPVALRAYDALAGGSSVADFLAFTGLGAAGSPLDAALRLNPRPMLAEMLTAFCGTHITPLLTDVRVQALLRGRQAQISAYNRTRFAARFAPGNADLLRTAGLPAGVLAIAPAPAADSLILERLFSAPVHAAITALHGTPDPARATDTLLAALATALPGAG